MPRVFRKYVKEVSNVAVSKTATITLPIGPRYHKVLIHHGYAGGTNTIAGALANITEIRLKVNGKTERKMTGAQLRDLNLLHGTQYDCIGLPNTSPGVSIPIFFTEPWRKDNQDGMSLALPTEWEGGRFETLTIEVDLATAGTPTLVAYAFYDMVKPKLSTPAPLFAKVFEVQAVPGGVEYTISTLVKRHWLAQLTVYPDSTNSRQPSQVILNKDSEDIHELPYAQNYAFLKNHDMFPDASGRTADVYDMVLDHQDLLSGAENLADARSLNLTIKAAAAMAGSQKIIAVVYGLPE